MALVRNPEPPAGADRAERSGSRSGVRVDSPHSPRKLLGAPGRNRTKGTKPIRALVAVEARYRLGTWAGFAILRLPP